MFFQTVDLSAALRPALQPGETLLFVQDGVGLYRGKYKIADYQRGHAYLTSHRICYVDDESPRARAVAVALKDVDRVEFQGRFLRSSPKITVLPRTRVPDRAERTDRERTDRASADWVCPICSFANAVPASLDGSSIPPCLACGIKPALSVILKAVSSTTSSTTPPITSSAPPITSTTFTTSSTLPSSTTPPITSTPITSSITSTTLPISSTTSTTTTTSIPSTIGCKRCTFANHRSLAACEICGAALDDMRSDSPAPSIAPPGLANTAVTDCVRLSFRNGGERAFQERLRGALIQRKWILQHAPPVPTTTSTATEQKKAGIAGLESRGMQTRRANETVLGAAFEDLEALMASAKEVVALAERFRGEEAEGAAAALGMMATRDVLTDGNAGLYVSELARTLAEFAAEGRGLAGGAVSLMELWAAFNRARNGVELVSPADFRAAAERWEALGLPVRLRRFRSGLLVVRRAEWTDERTLQGLAAWFEELRENPPVEETGWDWRRFGRGVSALEAGQRFGWSVGVAGAELEMAEERGLLCREQAVGGLRFWYNHLADSDFDVEDSEV